MLILPTQEAFTAPDRNLDVLPSSNDISDLQTEYTNVLTAIIDLLNGAKDLQDYLYRLAEYSPLTYAKLALQANGLQDYVDAMNRFN